MRKHLLSKLSVISSKCFRSNTWLLNRKMHKLRLKTWNKISINSSKCNSTGKKRKKSSPSRSTRKEIKVRKAEQMAFREAQQRANQEVLQVAAMGDKTKENQGVLNKESQKVRITLFQTIHPSWVIWGLVRLQVWAHLVYTWEEAQSIPILTEVVVTADHTKVEIKRKKEVRNINELYPN